MPRVSVCIPTYQGEKYIGDAILGALAQSFQDMEILVSDNASTDRTEQIVKSFHDPRVRYHRNQANIGYRANVEQMIHRMANGEYAVILCSDDYWQGDLLAEAVDILDRDKGIVFVHSGARILDEDTGIAKLAVPGDLEVERGVFFRRVLVDDRSCVFLSSAVFRRQLAVNVGAFQDPKVIYNPDMELWAMLSLRGPVKVIREPLITYRWHSHNLSKMADRDEGLASYLYVVDKLIGEGKGHGVAILKRDRDQAIRACWRGYVSAMAYSSILAPRPHRRRYYHQFLRGVIKAFRNDVRIFLSGGIAARVLVAALAPYWSIHMGLRLKWRLGL